MIRQNLTARICFVAAWLIGSPLLVVSLRVVSLRADEPRDSEAFFESKIRPALVDHCLDCHALDSEASGGLLLDSRQGWEAGGDSGPAIVLGDATASRLWRAMSYEDPHLQMPPDEKLSDAIIDDFKQWIAAGAMDPRQSDAQLEPKKLSGLPVERATEHWAYRPLEFSAGFSDGRSTPVNPLDAAEANPPTPLADSAHAAASAIDVLINERLRLAKLEAAPAAERATLARRLYFDLLGLPPTAEQLAEFLADEPEAAYARLVDRLLASPRFGETFARRWMDVVRYGDSITLRGFVLPQAWRYRDYLIDAFSSDRSFAQMIEEQLAGDLLNSEQPQERVAQLIATGFWALGNTNLEQQDKTQLEMDYIDEQLDVMGRTFLGQTLGCARCHDHKFDPIPTKDYYALAGILRSSVGMDHDNVSNWIEQPLPLPPEEEQRYVSLASERGQVVREIAELKKLVSALAKEKAKQEAQQDAKQDAKPQSASASDALGTDPPVTDAAVTVSPAEQLKALEGLQKQLDRELKLRPRYLTIAERNPPQDIPIHVRGDVHNLGDVVPRGFLTALQHASPQLTSDQAGRLELARWINADDNPLTARVYANRVWSWLMGQGLVASVDNFGTTGSAPSHPELLDWLARQLVEHAWSTKHLVREIVMSQAYRRAVVEPSEAALAMDPDNRLLWRGHARRISVEAMRDAMLQISGELELAVGGSLIPNSLAVDYDFNHLEPRRSIYQPVFRNSLPQLFDPFDFANSSLPTGQRARSTTAPQALVLMNHAWVIGRAAHAAERFSACFDAEPELRTPAVMMDRLCLECFARPATQEELALATAFLEPAGEPLSPLTTEHLQHLIQALYASLDFRYLD